MKLPEGLLKCAIVELNVLSENGKVLKGPVTSSLAISPIEKEVIISDKLTSELNIVLEDCGAGLWKFKGENKIRKSVKPQLW